MPAVTSAVHGVEAWCTEIEVVTVWIAGIHTEVPIACVPVEWTIEITGVAVHAILPIEQNVTQVQVAALPVEAVQVVIVVDAHQVVEVNLIGSLILVIGEVEFVCHLVRQEKSLPTRLVVTHGLG